MSPKSPLASIERNQQATNWKSSFRRGNRKTHQEPASLMEKDATRQYPRNFEDRHFGVIRELEQQMGPFVSYGVKKLINTDDLSKKSFKPLHHWLLVKIQPPTPQWIFQILKSTGYEDFSVSTTTVTFRVVSSPQCEISTWWNQSPWFSHPHHLL